MPDVEIEDPDTWPPDFLVEVKKNKALLVLYHQESLRTSKRAQEDLDFRFSRPQNQLKPEYKALAARLEEVLLQHRLVGYHCTRLTSEEIHVIQTTGLKILTHELVEHRLASARENGYLSEEHFNYLRDSKLIASSLGNENGQRTGMVWFCPNRSTLKDSSGVYRLFRSWGGEAIYNGHEEDRKIARVIASIGEPCIVKCAIPFVDAEQYSENFSERFFSFSVLDTIEYPDPSPGFDMNASRNLIAEEILEIIPISNPNFSELTGHTTWSKHEQI